MMLWPHKVSPIFALLSVGIIALGTQNTEDCSRKSIDPDQVGKISGFTVEQTPTLTVVTWDEITIGKCNTVYIVHTSSDVGNFSMIRETPSIDILSLYCFILDVEVYAEVEGVAGDPSIIRIIYELLPVEGLEIVTLAHENTFIAKWTAHEVQEQCDIEYMVTHNYGIGFEIRITNESSISFDIINCAATTITVQAINGDKNSEGRSVGLNDC